MKTVNKNRDLISSVMAEKVHLGYGGKADSLIKLVKMGVPVPEFFVVPSSYFKEFVIYNKLEKKILDLVKKQNYNSVKQLVLSSTFSDKMKNEIFDKVKELKLSEMSVRSSASNEDGKVKSFAGQYETFLNVKPSELLSKIVCCWLSILEDNVLSYIGDDEFNIYSVNVVVQKMINPDFAGVAFSKNPTSRSENYSLIESCRGVGEKLVSGETTPTRYIVRRELGVADLMIGEKMLSDKNISDIENYILKIEKEYKLPVDVEWCILDDCVYILQARPITAFVDEVISFDKRISRQKCLFELEIYNQGEFSGIKELTNGYYYFKPLFHVESPEITHIFYDLISLEEYPNSMLRELDRNYDKLYSGYEKVKENCKFLEGVITQKNKFDINEFVSKIIEIQPYSTLGNLIGHNWKVSQRVKDLLVEYRNKFDAIIYKSTDYLFERLPSIVSEEYHAYLPVLSLAEIMGKKTIKKAELKKRLNGFVFYDGKINFCSLQEFCDKNKFEIKKNQPKEDALRGAVAYSGKVTAAAKVILSTKDFDKFNIGDILVTSMTTPKFTSIMQKASGIITDEGGVTCHASIVARELKVPCIVGTKHATQTIKDGDIIILDANSGVVQIKK